MDHQLGLRTRLGISGQAEPHINNRSIVYSTGKVLGGSSSINVMAWIRGHRDDWNHFAAEAGDPAWNYESILDTYRDIEDWHGTPDPVYRGSGGPVFVQPRRIPTRWPWRRWTPRKLPA